MNRQPLSLLHMNFIIILTWIIETTGVCVLMKMIYLSYRITLLLWCSTTTLNLCSFAFEHLILFVNVVIDVWNRGTVFCFAYYPMFTIKYEWSWILGSKGFLFFLMIYGPQYNHRRKVSKLVRAITIS